MRRDALANLAGRIRSALRTSTSKDAIEAIAAEMARFYASDVLYRDYTLPIILGALYAAGGEVGGVDGVSIEGGQFVPNVQWLTPDYVAVELGVRLPARSGKPAPGIHGHRMDSVSVGATTLQTGATNTVPASPTPTFTCTFTNDGQNTETNVVVKVSVSGTSVSGQAIVPQTTPGEQATAQVTLNSPPRGTYTVTATVEQVPGETRPHSRRAVVPGDLPVAHQRLLRDITVDTITAARRVVAAAPLLRDAARNYSDDRAGRGARRRPRFQRDRGRLCARPGSHSRQGLRDQDGDPAFAASPSVEVLRLPRGVSVAQPLTTLRDQPGVAYAA
jgi:hypothetical protein